MSDSKDWNVHWAHDALEILRAAIPELVWICDEQLAEIWSTYSTKCWCAGFLIIAETTDFAGFRKWLATGESDGV